MALANLRKWLKRLKESSNKLNSFIEMKKMLSEIESDLEEGTPNFDGYRAELLYHCEALAGINDGNNHSAQQHYVWALSAIDKLESRHCLAFKSLQRQQMKGDF